MKVVYALMLSTTISACGGSSSNSNQNAAPSAINLSASSIVEKQDNQMIGDLTAIDSDLNDSHTFHTDNQLFILSG